MGTETGIDTTRMSAVDAADWSDPPAIEAREREYRRGYQDGYQAAVDTMTRLWTETLPDDDAAAEAVFERLRQWARTSGDLAAWRSGDCTRRVLPPTPPADL